MSKKQTPKSTTPTPSTPPKLSKREQLRAVRQRRTLMWNTILIGGGLAVLALVVWYFIAIAPPGQFPGEQNIPSEGQGHLGSRNADGTPATVQPSFQHFPPSSGQHYGDQVLPWGIYTSTEQIVLNDGVTLATASLEGVFVHNLEHGGVVFLYQCADNCADLETKLATMYANIPPDITFRSKKALVLPYDPAKMNGAPIIALAWTHQWNMTEFDETAMINWYKRFVNKGPELVP